MPFLDEAIEILLKEEDWWGDLERSLLEVKGLLAQGGGS